MGEFGEKFRKAREKKELSLDDVSNVTKIGSRMLQAIEEEHFDLLPGGVFNKGFIRAYAKHLGLNDEEAVTDYLACLRQAQIDAQAVWAPEPRAIAPEKPVPPPNKQVSKAQAPAQQTPQRGATQVDELPELQLPRAEHVRPPRKNYAEKREAGIPWRILAVAAVIIILAIVLWSRHSHGTRTEAAAAPTPATQPTPAPLTTPAPSSATPTSTPPSTTGSVASGAPSSLPASSNSPSPNAPPPAHPSAPASPKPVTNVAESNKEQNKEQSKEQTNDDEDATNPAPPPADSHSKAAPPLTLVIRATETSWISVTADGQPVSRETLIAPAHTSVRANREIVARIGNAAGVSFLWNGKEIPAEGAEAEVKTFVFDSTGMHEIPTQPVLQNR